MVCQKLKAFLLLKENGLKIIKVTPKKCIVKIYKRRNSFDLNRYNIRDFYNENLEHIKKKVKIISCEII